MTISPETLAIIIDMLREQPDAKVSDLIGTSRVVCAVCGDEPHQYHSGSHDFVPDWA